MHILHCLDKVLVVVTVWLEEETLTAVDGTSKEVNVEVPFVLIAAGEVVLAVAAAVAVVVFGVVAVVNILMAVVDWMVTRVVVVDVADASRVVDWVVKRVVLVGAVGFA